MGKEKKKNCRPLEPFATERPAAAMFILPVPDTRIRLPSEGSLHGARIFLSLS